MCGCIFFGECLEVSGHGQVKSLNMTLIHALKLTVKAHENVQFFAKSKFILTKPRFLKFKMLVFSCQFQGVNDPRPQVPQ